MNFQPTSLPEIILITPQIFSDDRGYFFESYNEEKFINAGITTRFIQDNQSYSKSGTLRGLHYQIAPKAQAKLIRVLEGEIFDVAIDIRENSPTFRQWVGITLNSKLENMLFIPEGFAHGFYVTSPTAMIAYKCSASYDPASERSLRWNDPKLNITWPLIQNSPVHLSKKDAEALLLVD